MRGLWPKRSAEADATWRRAVDEAKARWNISDVVAQSRKVTRAGREKRALCAFHDERSPSMQLSDAKGTYYCFGCGAGGDIVSYVMQTEGLGFLDALRWLGGADLPVVDPAQRAKAAAEDAQARAAAIEDARFMWSRCVSPFGTAAETYLRGRGINILPPAVRFGVVPTSRDEDGNWKRAYPALVMVCHDEQAGVVGLQRVFLTDDGAGKRWGNRSKLSLGRPRGSAVRLGGFDTDEVVICEGPEDGLSLYQELPQTNVWVALGTAMMPEIRFPASVTRVCIAGQNDAAGEAAAKAAATAFAQQSLNVRTMWPNERFKDWNDQLRGIER